MQLIATVQQEARELWAQAQVSRKTDFDVTLHTASPATSSAAYRPVGAPKWKNFKVIESTGEEQHLEIGANWDSFKKPVRCADTNAWDLRSLILEYKLATERYAITVQLLYISSTSRIEDLLPTTTMSAGPWRTVFAVS